MRRLAFVALSVALAASALLAAPQGTTPPQTPQQPTFRGGVRTVPVYATVRNSM